MEDTPDHRETIILFGGLSHSYLEEWGITGTANLDIPEKKIGVRFEEIPHEALMTRYGNLNAEEQTEASALAKQLLEEASQDPPASIGEAEIEKATRLHVAMKSFVEQRRADVVSITCGPFIRDADKPVPCVALTLFQDRGIPAACQGDIDALLTMVLFKRVSGQPSFMGGPIEDGGRLAVSH